MSLEKGCFMGLCCLRMFEEVVADFSHQFKHEKRLMFAVTHLGLKSEGHRKDAQIYFHTSTTIV